MGKKKKDEKNAGDKWRRGWIVREYHLIDLLLSKLLHERLVRNMKEEGWGRSIIHGLFSICTARFRRNLNSAKK
jgi:hypothetical protein